MRILVVDDASFMRSFLRDNLEEAGHEVVGFATNGEEAIEKFNELKPDLITMDINMPKMNGIDALIQIKKIDSSVKVVMISDMGQHSKIIEAIKNGASDFVIKPVHPARLKEALDNL